MLKHKDQLSAWSHVGYLIAVYRVNLIVFCTPSERSSAVGVFLAISSFFARNQKIQRLRVALFTAVNSNRGGGQLSKSSQL